MSREKTEKLVRALYAARLSNGLEETLSHFSPDGRLAISGSAEASAISLDVSGRPGIERVLADLCVTWEWLAQDIHRVLIDGDRVAVHYRLKTHFVPTGEVVETEIRDLLTFQSGKLMEIIQFVDTALAARLMAKVQSSQSASAT
jgi:ketosteroid isomerase-like protein